MQPYFFPYLGYFSLIEATDKWIVFDPVQYKRKAWVNRNRILKGDGGWQYFRFPVVKHSRNTLIQDIQVSYGEVWGEKIFGQIRHYQRRAPFFNEVSDLLKRCFADEIHSLPLLNAKCLKEVCNYLGIAFNYEIFSDMKMELPEITHPGEWALRISEEMGAAEYLNPPGGEAIFKPEQFVEAGVKLLYVKNRLTPYDQRKDAFENGLSIIDVLMFNSPAEALKLVQDYELVSPS